MPKPICIYCGKSDKTQSTSITQDLDGKVAYVHANCKVAYEEARKSELQKLTTTERQYRKQEFEESISYQTKPPSAREMMDEIMGIHEKLDRLLKPKKKPAKKL